MKKHIAEDGTRTHEFNASERKKLRSAILVLEEAAFFHRDNPAVADLDALIDDLSSQAACVKATETPKKG